MSKIFVVTDPEAGWDCVRGVYQANSKEELNDFLLKQGGFTEAPDGWEQFMVIHEKTLKVVESK